jgi:hypothetical protein
MYVELAIPRMVLKIIIIVGNNAISNEISIY